MIALLIAAVTGATVSAVVGRRLRYRGDGGHAEVLSALAALHREIAALPDAILAPTAPVLASRQCRSPARTEAVGREWAASYAVMNAAAIRR